MALLETQNIDISFSGIQILFDVNFQLQAGEINCLLGENGAGKSTLIKVITGIHGNYAGEILIDGEPVEINTPRDAIQQGIYAVQQHRDLAPTLNAVENMFMGNELFIGKSKQRFDYKKMTKIAGDYIAKFGVEIDLDVPVQDLKVSEQGIIAICKALLANSRILLIDEASAPLDDSERLVLYDTLQKLAKEGKGIVYITHHLDEVFRIGNSITVLRDGKVVEKVDTKDMDKDRLIESMTGNAKMYTRDDMDNPSELGEKLLEVESLTSKGLEDINIYARRGEILGIAGLEGSGKDDIAKCCFGFTKFKKGSIKVKGKEINPKSPISAIKNSVGLVPNDRKHAGLLLCRDITENIIITNINKYNKTIVTKGWADKTTKHYVKELSVKCAGPSQLVEYLSGGNQQKVLIARWLKSEVDILFMIEPTEGIDVGARSDLYAVFRELVKNGKTIIIATSDIDELLTLSDRIITMVGGKIINEYDIKDASKQVILADILSKAS
ncbi:MAG: sugar ABC transporter ATP-binding protein [Clostridia bacterium]|nr:sugar ABC transporter ATP-binding protein [Clostridia bacterium]